MPTQRSTTLTRVELEFMQIIWKNEEITSGNIHATLAEQDRHIVDGAVRRILLILMDKGYLFRRQKGKGFLYRAKVQKKQAIAAIFHDIRKRAFGGSGSLMIASLFDSLEVSADEMNEIKRLIEKRERNGEK